MLKHFVWERKPKQNCKHVLQVLSAGVEQVDAVGADARVCDVVGAVVDDRCVLADRWDCSETDAAIEVVGAVSGVRCTGVCIRVLYSNSV